MCKFLKISFLFILTVGLLSSSKLAGQSQTEEISDKNIKFLSFKPANYDSKNEHPLLIFLHGMGERGSNLDLVKRNGPPKLIDRGQWPSDRPFIVISPQLSSIYGNWPPSMVDDLIEYVKAKYKVDNSRIYVTGLSLGGNGAWMYATSYPEKVAATVPIAGWGAPHKACEMKDVPVWAFHGDADGTVNISGSKNMVNGINACIPDAKVAPKFTIYPGVGHDSWTKTYDLSAGHDIYSWMLKYTNDGEVSRPNLGPSVNAGSDKVITLPTNSISISGSASDSDGSITSYSWTQTSGPGASLQDADKTQLKVLDLVEGEYNFRLTVKDNEGASASDEVRVTVNPAPTPVNENPIVDAGDDKSITLPENNISISATASDSDGSVASYTWAKTSGPDASLQDTDKAQLMVSDMIEGEYIFKLTVKDNDGASSSDEVKVTVNPAPTPVNENPIVSAGDDKTITLPENNISISGTASDNDGSIASYTWSKTSGPDASLQDTDKAQLIVSDMIEGEYIFKLTVKDNDGASNSDEVKVTVNPVPTPVNENPIVSAGDDKTITLPENNISISATASDSDGSIASYTWSKTSGPYASLRDTDKAQVMVSDMTEGAYTFKLTVKDNDGASSSDEVKVTVNSANNNTPLVSAGDDKIITLPENNISISGTASDNDGSIASYTWSKTNGPDASLQDTDKAQLMVSDMIEGVYIFKLTVKDNDGAYNSDEVKVTVNPAPTPVNENPIVSAGDDKTITLPENNISISGTASDSDGSIASYTWSKTSGPDASLQDTDKAQLMVSDMIEGEYIFKLTVKDNDDASSADEVKVTVHHAPTPVNENPIVSAGDDKTITLPENSISISGTASDSDGSVASYAWSKTSGPDASLQDNDKVQLMVSDMIEGVYIFKLTVKDNDGAYNSDEMKVTVNPAPALLNENPTVNAGDDKTITLPEDNISILGTASDSDGSIASYTWSQTSGPDASLQDTDKAQLIVSDMSEGAYTFKLTVKDNDGVSSSDEVKVIVNPANVVPIVSAGNDIIISLPNNSITINGSANDSDGTITSFNWSKKSGPTTILSETNNSSLSLSNLVAGNYVFELTVTDNEGATASDEVRIRVNNPPSANAGYDKNISLPTNALLLSGAGSDSDGTITSYRWNKISGGNVVVKDENTHLLSLSGLEEGIYEFELTVKDNNGAPASDIVKVTVNPASNINPIAQAGKDIVIKLPENSVILTGAGSDQDGQIIKFEWEQISGENLQLENTTSADLLIMNLNSGVYEFELSVTDNKGAMDFDRVKVTVEDFDPIDPLVIETTTLNPTCFGESNGGAEAIVTGGTAPYSFNWSNGSTESSISNIPAGDYTVTVTDKNGSQVKATISLSAPEAIVINASVSDEKGGRGLGAIDIIISGGTAPYQTKWLINNTDAPNLQGNKISGLKANVYTIQVTDANGCVAHETFTVNKKEKNSIAVFPNPSEGSFKVAIHASGGAYELNIIDSKGKIIHKESGNLNENGNIAVKEYNLQAEGRGIYFVKVQYESGAFSINRIIIK